MVLNCIVGTAADGEVQIISEIKASGLRGRGGAGFPSGLKWVGKTQQENQSPHVVLTDL